MPVLLRGLTDRISGTKKAALIFDNMCSMVNDAKDLAPHLDTICMQTLLLDSIPECRTVASKARGMLVKGQSHFPHLVPRAACHKAFDVFHKSMGYRSIDELIPIPRLLKRIMSVKSRAVLPYLAPHLLTTPTALTKVQVIMSVSGAVLHRDMDCLCKSAR
ncbi:hypothetical protein SDRG_15696 [Saprolegnia diclina VS20]|uniref:Uncharacterized protein n=1 Tax=Saprolegnia diclina (strain VS20) TaxID=1156394 RepID=T0R3A8_SAPDV|nr:hypothetical protein SDRG_15696 [Saprolegnia diclina VS20]EQC26518.1 hypothetical protein SDRG_15696 [Saprolegnia diclina VS20]|eukprot:XP_008620097.1 hypothetical protein SDRG_15696 [Saprolegnia diclina VS20]